ncbi:MAG: YfhO family protein, partial [Chloroflexota bacterium]
MYRLKPIWPIIILAILTLIFFWKILLTNLILVGIDTFLYFYPYKTYATQALLSGRIPLWNPHIFMGVPFLANSQVGLFYPLNWLFLWATPPKQVAYSIGLHIWLAGWGAYLFARYALQLRQTEALLGGLIFAFSGFLGAQVEHVNQLQVSAWLPWLFLCFDQIVQNQGPISTPDDVRQRMRYFWQARRTIGWLGLIIGLMLLAGHTQSLYISCFGLGLYGLTRRGIPWGSVWAVMRTAITVIVDLLVLIPAIVLALLISAVQLLPTAELTQRSIRSEGLTYNEVVSFSLNPLKSWLTILPPYGLDLEANLGPAFSEFVGYIGLTGLILVGLGVIYIWRNRQDNGMGIGLTGLAGLGLSFGLFTGPIYVILYWYVPGFSLFRVPARWLLLYTFAVAMIAAIGFAQIKHRRWQWLVLFLIPLELLIAAQSLRYNQPTAPEAYSFLRPAIAQLKTAQAPTDRFLSLSGTEYDPGDLKEIRNIFADQLSERAVYDYVITAKQKEVLFFNLPMVYNLNAVDGYDGGLLPLKRFIEWQELFLPADDVSTDGRLREKLQRIPPAHLLSPFGVRHIITDKVFDVWLNDIFYDLQFPAILDPQTQPEIWTEDIPNFRATAIGVVFHTPMLKGHVADLIVRDDMGREMRFPIEAGAGTPWENAEYGVDYNLVFAGLDNQPISAIGLVAKNPVTVRGISLIQTANSTSRSVILSTEGNYRFIHGGDIKIYENRDVLPPAFIVHQAQLVTDTNAVIDTFRQPNFSAEQAMVQIIQAGQTPGLITRGEIPATPEPVVIDSYAPEQIDLTTTLETPGWLVLMDTYYPGWEARVNDQPVEIEEVNLMFRAVELPTGTHHVHFTYRPESFRWGWMISVGGLVLLGIL